MDNPWLDIPASDYEAHMALPEVAQAQALSRLMGATLREHRPASLAVMGCSTGNGFERIDATCTRRVVGVDINHKYLKILGDRLRGRIPGLEPVCADVAAPTFGMAPVEMVFAGLIFEYVEVRAALRNIVRCLVPGGYLVAVLQEESLEADAVTHTPYTSLARLSLILRLVPPEAFSRSCSDLGLEQVKTGRVPLKQGKAFFVGQYRKPA